MTDWTTDLTFEEEQTFSTEFTEAETFNTTMDQVTEVVTSDHTKLINRDVPEQHPIGAITNLDTQLDNRVVSGNALTNQEIEQIIIGG